MIAQYRTEYPLRLMCRVLAVSPAGFYAWQRRPPSARQVQDTGLQVAIAVAHRQSRRRYGSPRLQVDLRENGHRVGRERIRRLMRALGPWGSGGRRGGGSGSPRR